MDLNNIVFPAPEFNVETYDALADEVLYIPCLKSNDSEIKRGMNSIKSGLDDKRVEYRRLSSQEHYKDFKSFVPCICLLLKPFKNKVSKNFLIMFHGNAEDIFIARELGDLVRERLMINVLLVEYPGYSIYKDEKSSERVLENALIVYDFLVNKFKVAEENIYVFGRSIGSAPAMYLCSKRKPAALVVISPFTSVRAVAQNMVGNVLKFLVGER
jgi:hypothetical protein